MPVLAPVTGMVIGESITLVKESDLHAVFAPFGWTRRDFRLMYQAFGVPYLRSPRQERWVWLESFQFSFVMVLGFNQANFEVPGHERSHREKIPGEKNRRTIRRRMSQAMLRKRFATAINELSAIRHFDFSAVTPQMTREQYEKAAARMSVWLAQFVEGNYDANVKNLSLINSEDLRAAKDSDIPSAE